MAKTKKSSEEVKQEIKSRVESKQIEALKSIILNDDQTKWRKSWSNEGLLQRNVVTDKPYRGTNQFVLLVDQLSMQKPDVRWMTRKQAEKAGYEIKEGAQSSLISFYSNTFTVDKKDEQGNFVLDEEGKRVKQVIQTRPILKSFFVYNGADIEGLAPFVPPNYTPEEITAQKAVAFGKAEALIKDWIADSGLKYVELPQRSAFFRPNLVDKSKSEIALPMREQFEDLASYYATALHELAHSTMLKEGMRTPFYSDGRPNPSFSDPRFYAREELVAELTSLHLCQELGIDTSNSELNAQSLAYIRTWYLEGKLNDEDLLIAMKDANKVSQTLLKYTPEFSVEQTLELIDKYKKSITENVQSENVEVKDEIVQDVVMNNDNTVEATSEMVAEVVEATAEEVVSPEISDDIEVIVDSAVKDDPVSWLESVPVRVTYRPVILTEKEEMDVPPELEVKANVDKVVEPEVEKTVNMSEDLGISLAERFYQEVLTSGNRTFTQEGVSPIYLDNDIRTADSLLGVNANVFKRFVKNHTEKGVNEELTPETEVQNNKVYQGFSFENATNLYQDADAALAFEDNSVLLFKDNQTSVIQYNIQSLKDSAKSQSLNDTLNKALLESDSMMVLSKLANAYTVEERVISHSNRQEDFSVESYNKPVLEREDVNAFETLAQADYHVTLDKQPIADLISEEELEQVKRANLSAGELVMAEYDAHPDKAITLESIQSLLGKEARNDEVIYVEFTRSSEDKDDEVFAIGEHQYIRIDSKTQKPTLMSGEKGAILDFEKNCIKAFNRQSGLPENIKHHLMSADGAAYRQDYALVAKHLDNITKDKEEALKAGTITKQDLVMIDYFHSTYMKKYQDKIASVETPKKSYLLESKAYQFYKNELQSGNRTINSQGKITSVIVDNDLRTAESELKFDTVGLNLFVKGKPEQYANMSRFFKGVNGALLFDDESVLVSKNGQFFVEQYDSKQLADFFKKHAEYRNSPSSRMISQMLASGSLMDMAHASHEMTRHYSDEKERYNGEVEETLVESYPEHITNAFGDIAPKVALPPLEKVPFQLLFNAQEIEQIKEENLSHGQYLLKHIDASKENAFTIENIANTLKQGGRSAVLSEVEFAKTSSDGEHLIAIDKVQLLSLDANYQNPVLQNDRFGKITSIEQEMQRNFKMVLNKKPLQAPESIERNLIRATGAMKRDDMKFAVKIMTDTHKDMTMAVHNGELDRVQASVLSVRMSIMRRNWQDLQEAKNEAEHIKESLATRMNNPSLAEQVLAQTKMLSINPLTNEIALDGEVIKLSPKVVEKFDVHPADESLRHFKPLMLNATEAINKWRGGNLKSAEEDILPPVMDAIKVAYVFKDDSLLLVDSKNRISVVSTKELGKNETLFDSVFDQDSHIAFDNYFANLFFTEKNTKALLGEDVYAQEEARRNEANLNAMDSVITMADAVKSVAIEKMPTIEEARLAVQSAKNLKGELRFTDKAEVLPVLSSFWHIHLPNEILKDVWNEHKEQISPILDERYRFGESYVNSSILNDYFDGKKDLDFATKTRLSNDLTSSLHHLWKNNKSPYKDEPTTLVFSDNSVLMKTSTGYATLQSQFEEEKSVLVASVQEPMVYKILANHGYNQTSDPILSVANKRAEILNSTPEAKSFVIADKEGYPASFGRTEEELYHTYLNRFELPLDANMVDVAQERQLRKMAFRHIDIGKALEREDFRVNMSVNTMAMIVSKENDARKKVMEIKMKPSQASIVFNATKGGTHNPLTHRDTKNYMPTGAELVRILSKEHVMVNASGSDLQPDWSNIITFPDGSELEYDSSGMKMSDNLKERIQKVEHKATEEALQVLRDEWKRVMKPQNQPNNNNGPRMR